MIVEAKNLEFNSPNGFIVIEGVNGAGKSTLIRSLNNILLERGLKFIFTLEPGGSELGKHLRKILLDPANERPSVRSELLLFAADRAEHVEKVIRPAILSGSLVISDRYFYSTTAFQGYGRGIPLEMVETVNKIATDNCIPDLVILLDIEVKEGLKRTKSRNNDGQKDAFEDEEIAFHERIREGFLTLAKSRPESFLIIDAKNTQEEVLTQAINAINKLLEAKNVRE